MSAAWYAAFKLHLQRHEFACRTGGLYLMRLALAHQSLERRAGR